MAAPSGGGGGGGPVGFGNSFTGTAEAIEVMGEHAYAYSGAKPANTTAQTALSFTSGNYYLVGTIEVHGFVDDDSPSTRISSAVQCKFNGATVLILSTVAYRSPMSDSAAIIIPPYTEVVVLLDADSDDADAFATVSIAGRIYR